MKNLLWILLLTSFSALGVEEDNAGDSENNRECKVSTVINKSDNSVYSITRCVEKVSVGDLVESNETKPTKPSAQQDSQHDWERINSAADLSAQNRMADATEEIRNYTLTGVIVGALGLIFLWRTVTHSQTASGYALQTLNVARDDYSCALVAKTTQHNARVFGGEISSTITIINEGKTEANYCTYKWAPVAVVDGKNLSIQGIEGSGVVNDGTINPTKPEMISIKFPDTGEDDFRILMRLEGLDRYRRPFCVDFIILGKGTTGIKGDRRFICRPLRVVDRWYASLDRPYEAEQENSEEQQMNFFAELTTDYIANPPDSFP